MTPWPAEPWAEHKTRLDRWRACQALVPLHEELESRSRARSRQNDAVGTAVRVWCTRICDGGTQYHRLSAAAAHPGAPDPQVAGRSQLHLGEMQ